MITIKYIEIGTKVIRQIGIFLLCCLFFDCSQLVLTLCQKTFFAEEKIF